MGMTFIEVIDRACEEPTLEDALTWVAIQECERVIPIAHAFLNGKKERGPDGRGWDTCFGYLIEEVMREYPIKQTLNKLKGKK